MSRHSRKLRKPRQRSVSPEIIMSNPPTPTSFMAELTKELKSDKTKKYAKLTEDEIPVEILKKLNLGSKSSPSGAYVCQSSQCLSESSDDSTKAQGKRETSMFSRPTQVNFVKLNAIPNFKTRVKREEKPDPTRPPPFYKKGCLPKYLKGAKKDVSKDGNNDEGGMGEGCQMDPPVPEDHILLSDAERREHLKQVRQTYANVVNQLNSLALKGESPKYKKQRIELENELEKLENAIKLFSREKLYVKIVS